MAATTAPCLSTITRTDTLTVPRIVSRALRGTSGITSFTVDGGVSGCCRASDSTVFVSSSAEFVTVVSVAGCGSGLSPTTDEFSVRAAKGATDSMFAAGLEAGGSDLRTLKPSQHSGIATAPRISNSALLLKRRRAGGGGSCGSSLMRITKRPADGVSNWDLATGSGIADAIAGSRSGVPGEVSTSRRPHHCSMW